MASPSQTVRFWVFFSAPRALPLLLHILMTEADVCVSRNPGQLQSLKSLVSSEMSKSYQQVFFVFIFFREVDDILSLAAAFMFPIVAGAGGAL